MLKNFQAGDKVVIFYDFYDVTKNKYYSFYHNDNDSSLNNKTVKINNNQITSLNDNFKSPAANYLVVDYENHIANYSNFYSNCICSIESINKDILTIKYSNKNTIHYNIKNNDKIYFISEVEEFLKNKYEVEINQLIKTHLLALEVKDLLNDITNIGCINTKSRYNEALDPILGGIEGLGWNTSSLFC